MKKIMIVGRSGGGKSTLAKELATKLSLPLYHLDRYFWEPGWKEVDTSKFIDLQYELVSQDAWIIDGNAMRTIAIRMLAADTIIFLDIPRWRCIYNVIKRQIQSYGKDRADMGEGCPMKFDKNFFKFLLYIWNYNQRFKPSILRYMKIAKEEGTTVYHLRSYKEVDALSAILLGKPI